MPSRKTIVTPRELTAAIIIFLLFGLLWRESALRWEADRRETFDSEDMPLINRAIDLWSVENNQPNKDDIRAQRFPIVVQFRNETCVALTLKLFAAAGGTPIYCFDPKTRRLTRTDLSHAQ